MQDMGLVHRDLVAQMAQARLPDSLADQLKDLGACICAVGSIESIPCCGGLPSAIDYLMVPQGPIQHMITV